MVELFPLFVYLYTRLFNLILVGPELVCGLRSPSRSDLKVKSSDSFA